MAFNRNSVNLGNQFSHAAAVSRGEASENNNRSRSYFHIPKGMKGHKWTEKEERFNILLAKNNATDPDDTGYKFYKAVPVHELPNLADPKHPHQYPCLKIIGKPCPCCERKENLDDGSKGGENWERIKPFIPKDRVLYYMNPENTNDILVHECAAKQKGEAAFPQRLMAQATAMSEGSLPIPFASPNEDGRIIKVNTAKDTFGGHEYYSASAVNFFPRRELPADELYERCKPWNELLNFGTYEEMERVMNGGEPDPYTMAAPAASNASPEHTEEEKQAEFERACEQSLRDNAMTNGALNQWNNQHPANAAPAGFQQASQPATHYTAPAQEPPVNNGFQPANAAPNGFQRSPVNHPAQGFQTSPANGPLMDEDFSRDPYAAAQPPRNFPSEQAAPANPAPAAGGCPFGLRLGIDFETSRKCCNCTSYDLCAKARRNA